MKGKKTERHLPGKEDDGMARTVKERTETKRYERRREYRNRTTDASKSSTEREMPATEDHRSECQRSPLQTRGVNARYRIEWKTRGRNGVNARKGCRGVNCGPQESIEGFPLPLSLRTELRGYHPATPTSSSRDFFPHICQWRGVNLEDRGRTGVNLEDRERTAEGLKAISVSIPLQFSSTVLYRLYIPDLVSRELVMGMTWTPTWKSVPNDNKGLLANRGMKGKDTIFTCLKYEIASVGVEVVHARQRDSDPIRILHYTSMFSRQTLKPFEPEYNRQVLELGWRAVKYDSLWLSDPSVGEPLWCSPGRLAAVLSGGGKRRIFIIGNFIKQRLFRPIHDWSMEILRSLPCDGTFNQSKPIERLVRAKASKVYSFDLSSATDRYPMRALFYLIWSIFGSIPAAAIVRHLAEGAILIKPPYTWRKRYIKFNTGQPLGYYGCWSLFSLSHHCMVWMAAANVDGRYRQKPFTDYALLGDDIVIINPAVAKEYKRIMVKLGVSISEGKSLVSSNGSFEFAKQFWVKRGQVNLSPVSAPAVLAARSFIGLTQLGLKYKVSKNVILRGNPINPYYKGIIIADALRKYKFKDLVTVPEEYWKDDERQYNTVESTLYRSWIEDWLKWVKWYCEVMNGTDTGKLELMYWSIGGSSDNIWTSHYGCSLTSFPLKR
ncbi:hypothetical protein ZIOFF_074484 (mitochondrion) [Zingiber officinale]|uniref:RNA-dependent RNA polymerase n=1 Tax=Zingiber officinale TaxID=94328 RepID=A0A8J5C5W3_ZINOF|nr:hypothetical protein ZIOFF_074484 [Zingiber officinale]